MAKHRNPNVVAFTALGTAFGEATCVAPKVKSPVDRRVAESRARGIKDSLALLFETLPAKANHEFYATTALRAANAVRKANGFDPLDALLLTPEPKAPTQEKTAPAPKTGKTAASTRTSGTPSKTTGEKRTPKVDRYVIDDTQCNGLTKSGTQCRHNGINGTGYCLQHQGQVPDAKAPKSASTQEKSKTSTRQKTSTPKPKTEVPASTPTPQEKSKTSTRLSTREKLLAKRKAEAEALSEAELAEAQAEADFLAEAKEGTSVYLSFAERENPYPEAIEDRFQRIERMLEGIANKLS